MNEKTETMTVLPAEGIATTLCGEDVTHVIFILDRSGSMHGKEADVIGGFNSYVDELRREPEGQVGLSYVRFDNELELVWSDVPLADVPRMDDTLYAPRGATALLDAIGTTLSAVREREGHRYTVIIHTDGLENASREWTGDAVKNLIEKLQAKGNWTFAFFGEGIDAWQQADAYGFSGGRRAAYKANDRESMWKATARVSNVMRKRKMGSTARFADVSAAVVANEAMSDEELASRLETPPGAADVD
jgi:uncharacterized protein YegL